MERATLFDGRPFSDLICGLLGDLGLASIIGLLVVIAVTFSG